MLNGGFYAAEGDWTNAGLSMLSAVPLAGDALAAGKLGVKYGGKALAIAEEGVKLVGEGEHLVDATATVATRADEAVAAVGAVAGRADEAVEGLGRGPDFIVDSRGTTLPTNRDQLLDALERSGAFEDVSTNPISERKFKGVDNGAPVRIRVEKGHPEDPSFRGTPDPLHTVDHLHVERRVNGATGDWFSDWKVPFGWPW